MNLDGTLLLMEEKGKLPKLKKKQTPLEVINEDIKKTPCDFLRIGKIFLEEVEKQPNGTTLETRISLVNNAPN